MNSNYESSLPAVSDDLKDFEREREREREREKKSVVSFSCLEIFFSGFFLGQRVYTIENLHAGSLLLIPLFATTVSCDAPIQTLDNERCKNTTGDHCNSDGNDASHRERCKEVTKAFLAALCLTISHGVIVLLIRSECFRSRGSPLTFPISPGIPIGFTG